MITKKLVEREVEVTKTEIQLVEKEVEVTTTELRTLTLYEHDGEEYTAGDLEYEAKEWPAKCQIHNLLNHHAYNQGRYLNGEFLRNISYNNWKEIHSIIQKQIEFKELLDSTLTNDE